MTKVIIGKFPVEWVTLVVSGLFCLISVVLVVVPHDPLSMFRHGDIDPIDDSLSHGTGSEVTIFDLPPADELSGILSGEKRVMAYGSHFPIPYEADVCPFFGVKQPGPNQMDRDRDGMTDDWEIRYGLDRDFAGDAKLDSDGDGFTHLEEFRSGSDPLNSEAHPLYAEKLRFIAEKKESFPLVFKGFTELGDGSLVFQVNNHLAGKTHFASLGDDVEGVVLERFVSGKSSLEAMLVVRRGDHEVELLRGSVVPDPESKAELINVLDQSRVIVTMGALLSLHSDEYTVLGVYSDKVVLKHLETGKVFDIVGLADGK